jgi:hypothetical protein
MLTSVNHITPASGNPLRESRPAGIGIRLRAADPDAAVERVPDLDRLLRVAAVYEAITDTARNAADRRAAAFVAATAYQIVGRIDTRRGFAADDMLTANAIHPALAAPLLFVIAGQSPDAREAGLRLQGLASEDLVLTALLESVADLSAERFEAILARAAAAAAEVKRRGSARVAGHPGALWPVLVGLGPNSSLGVGPSRAAERLPAW